MSAAKPRGVRSGAGPSGRGDAAIDEVVDQVMVASRALVGIAAQSLADTESDVTLRQYRALVLLASRGDLNVSGLADALEIHPSTATRLCDRLLAKGLIERTTSNESRREVTVGVSAGGRSLLRGVTARRRRAIRRVVDGLDRGARQRLIDAFTTFAAAAGELPDHAWKLGWATPPRSS